MLDAAALPNRYGVVLVRGPGGSCTRWGGFQGAPGDCTQPCPAARSTCDSTPGQNCLGPPLLVRCVGAARSIPSSLLASCLVAAILVGRLSGDAD